MRDVIWRIGFAAVILVVAGNSRAQETDPPPGDFALGIGYANLSIGGSDSALDSEDALRFDSAFTFSPLPNLPQLRLGAAFGVALVLDNSERAIISNDGGLVIIGSSDIPLWTMEPEARLSWKQSFGDEGTFYIEPGVGVGWIFANLDIDADDTTLGTGIDEWDNSFFARAFINVGFQVEGGLAGFQASYLWADDLDLAGNVSGEANEFYIGFFGALQF